MYSNFLVKIAAGLVAGGLFLACSGIPEVPMKDTGPDGGGSGGMNGSGGDAPIAMGGRVNVGDPEGGAGGGGTVCKTSCEAKECGVIADGCGDSIECPDCTAPETCGGGGIPSECGGDKGCVPKTCDELGATCGSQSDGCGGIVECWTTRAKTCAVGEQCIDGTCTDPTDPCEKLTCADYAKDKGLCGLVSDACNGTIDCGFECATNELCGAQEPGKCGTAVCDPMDCTEARTGKPEGYCGFVADGCGGEVPNCKTTCTGNNTCGGGGEPDVCGHGTTVCVPTVTKADCGLTCGPIGDGCGGTVDCGGCMAPDTCGGGAVSGRCGSPVCIPNTCPTLGFNCGTTPNGCGGELNCGSCGTGSFCNANKCEAIVCVPKTTAQVCEGVDGKLCGLQSDGCSGTVDCGGCTAPNTCGGGGTASRCGAPPCTPLTCADQNANCGPVSDGCTEVVQCGTCTLPETCGGGGIPSRCGRTISPDCTGLCPDVDTTCTAGNETRLTGTVFAPNGSQPIYSALVYVPNAPIPAIQTGPSCDRCEDEELGSPIAAAITGADGKFVLRNVPAGVSFPLVVKIGKWRRVVTIPAQPRCTNVNLAASETRLPRNMQDATPAGNVQYVNIPRMAMVTGDVDEIECVLRKIGVSDSEFTQPTGTGRIHLYRSNGAYATCTSRRNDGSCRDSGRASTPLSTLFSGTTINNYDIGIFDCEGAANEHNTYDPLLRAWADRGGRVFASHYSYTYLHDNGNYASTATWGGTQNANGANTTGIIDQGTGKGRAFNTWLGNVGAWSPTYGSGYISISAPREYVQASANGTERFVYTDSTHRANPLANPAQSVQINQRTAVQQYSFNTPVGASAANICGRILYSAFHVADASGNSGAIFPEHCSNGPLTPQEQVLEFMLFDLSSCVSIDEPPPPPTCTARTCAGVGATCGQIADGCGGLLNCGVCTPPNTCGGGGVANQCGSSCKRRTCGEAGATCGIVGDGCGGTLNCGDCTPPAICGGGGQANVCGTPSCTPRSCADVGATCGAISNGCNATIDCGVCTSPQTCGGGGTPNQCGNGTCVPKTCAGENAVCGFIGDGCGGTVQCGTCEPGKTCTGNQCVGGCTPRTCAQANANCGFVGDGCGGAINCGVCTPPLICGGGGTPSRCGGSCTPRSCTAAMAECGAVSDGCGNVLQCGVCPPGQTCGAGGPNKCGQGVCTPKTCMQLDAECGSVGDGCGNVLDCGVCVAPESCGGAGVPNKCGKGTGGCPPKTCAEQNANCGPVSDGCNGLLDCGVCVPGETCGGGGIPSQCGTIR